MSQVEFTRAILLPGLLAGASLASLPAVAATIVVDCLSSSSVSAGSAITIPSTVVVKTNTYDFKFNTASAGYDPAATTNIVVRASMPPAGIALLTQYQLYAGDPGAGAFIGQSTKDFSPWLIFNPTPGDYYIEITPRGIARSGEIVSGAIATTNTAITAVPEPAAWTLAMTGFLGLGLVLRSRRKTAFV